MGRRVYAVDAEKDYVMAGIELLFIVSLRCEMKMKQAKVITAVRCSSPLSHCLLKVCKGDPAKEV